MKRRPEADIARILLAEGDPVQRRTIRLLLVSPRISVMEVEDGDAALSLIAMRPFDLLMLDAGLPRMSGPETLAWIRRTGSPWSDIPVLGLVDAKERSSVGEMLALGMSAWTAKPVDRKVLYQTLVRLLPGLHDAGL